MSPYKNASHPNPNHVYLIIIIDERLIKHETRHLKICSPLEWKKSRFAEAFHGSELCETGLIDRERLGGRSRVFNKSFQDFGVV